MFSKIYFKALALITLIVAAYTGVMLFYVSPKIEDRTTSLEEKTGKAHLQEIATVVESSAKELKSYHNNSIKVHKQELKNITDVAFTLVEKLYESSLSEAVKDHIFTEVNTFRNNLTTFYQQSRNSQSAQDIQEFIKGFVKLYRYDRGTGYFFINQGTRCVLHPIKPAMDGMDLVDLKDSDGKYFIRDFVQLVKSKKEGFISYKWLNPSSNQIEEKITYIFYFAPFDWIIGTGAYLEEIKRQKQKEAIDYVANLRYEKNEYFYISNYDSVLISHPSLQGRDMSNVRDPEGILIVPPLVQIARKKGEGFHSYSWVKLDGNNQLYKKLTFAKHIPNWEWIIGTGLYLDSVESQVETKKIELVKNLRKILTTTKIADTGYIYIFDSKGNMILHPNSNIEGKNFSKLTNPGKKSFILVDLINAYKSGKKVLYYTWDKPSDKGNYIYDKVSWIDYNKDFDWYICSSAYLAEINSTAEKLKQYIWIISLSLFVFALLVSAFFLKKLVHPIETLSRTALKVKKGDLTVRSQITANDDIGTLAQTFDGMLDTIEENIKTLDKKVNERTKDLQCMIEKLDYLASHDTMTGILNRRKFFELATPIFNEHPKNLYAAMIDIDKFKRINDTHGHPAGDLVISAVTGTISSQLRKGAIFGRLGGEEFAFVVHYQEPADAQQHLQSIRKKVEQLEITIDSGKTIRCTISIGVVKADNTIQTLDQLLHRADKLLYRAKGSGRNKAFFRI
jgi:diguanylate cyclase (GGDEF)-like protein